MKPTNCRNIIDSLNKGKKFEEFELEEIVSWSTYHEIREAIERKPWIGRVYVTKADINFVQLKIIYKKLKPIL